MDNNEGELLYNLASNCKGNGVIVEIGSWQGKSTIWLGKGSKRGSNVPIYAIDPHTGSSEHKKMYGEVYTFTEFKKNIKNAEVEDIITPVLKTSEVAGREFNKPVELIFIDGAHEYDIVKLDFTIWFPKVIDGGIMAFHDTGGDFYGPKAVVEELLYKSRDFRNIKRVGSITFAEKTKENSIANYFKNRYALFLVNHYILQSYHRLVLCRMLRKIEKSRNFSIK